MSLNSNNPSSVFAMDLSMKVFGRLQNLFFWNLTAVAESWLFRHTTKAGAPLINNGLVKFKGLAKFLD
jgi:hypothetical protein